MGKRFSIRIMDGSISAERTTTPKRVPSSLSLSLSLFLLIPRHWDEEGTAAAAADVVSADIIDK